MPRLPEVHFRLKPKDEDGRCLIYLQFLYSKQRLFFSFGQKIKLEQWNAGKERVKKSTITTDDGKYSLNDLLDNLQRVCEKTYTAELKKGIPHPDVLKKSLEEFMNQNSEDPDEGPNLFKLLQRFIANEISFRGKSKSLNTIKTYNTLRGHLLEYQHVKKEKVNFENINLDFFYKYVDFLSRRNQHERAIRQLRPELKNKPVDKLEINSISKDIQILKVVMGEAVDLGYTSNLTFKHSKFSVARQDTDAVYLNEDELHALYKKNLSGNKKLEQVRDLFIFGCWVGLRFSDYNNVKPENIVSIDNDLFIKIIPQKTSDLVIIPCNPVVLDIFKKYENNVNRLPKSLSNQKFNDYIKEVCKIAGLTDKGRLSTDLNKELWECISSHTARRSFATNLYLDGYPVIEIMKITGHRTEKAFLRYIRVTKLDAAKRLSAHIKKRWSEKMLKVA
jgi:integrase